MFLRKLAIACLLGSLECFSPDGSTGTPIGDNNVSCGERPCKRALITELQPSPAVFQAQEEVSPTTCKVCKFEHKNLEDNQHPTSNKRAKTQVNLENYNTPVEMYRYPLFQYKEGSLDIIEFYPNFVQSFRLDPRLFPFSKLRYELSLYSHSECALFRFTTFGWLKDNFETQEKPQNLNINFFEIPMLQIDFLWVMAFIKRFQSVKAEEQTEVPAIQTDANGSTEIRNIYMSLPDYVKEFLRSSNQTNCISEELLMPSTGQETWEEMIENPFLFYGRFSENMERLKDVSVSSSLYRKKLEEKNERRFEIESLLKKKNLNFQDKENLEIERKQVIGNLSLLKEKQKNEIEPIVRAIDSVLLKMDEEDNNNQIENYALKVILIMQIMNTCIHHGVKLCNYAGICIVWIPDFIERLGNNTLDFKTFIYNLGIRKSFWKVSMKPNSKEVLVDTVEFFQSFINCTAPNLYLSKIKVITFWVAKVVLESPVNNLPLLCYILYKNQLMDEPRIYMVFRYSYIIKRWFIAKWNINNTISVKCCFEKTIRDSSIKFRSDNIAKFVKSWNLVKRLKINPNLLFSSNSVTMKHYRDKLKIGQVTNHQNGEKDFISEKVADLFMDIYSEMNSIILSVRNMLLNPV